MIPRTRGWFWNWLHHYSLIDYSIWKHFAFLFTFLSLTFPRSIIFPFLFHSLCTSFIYFFSLSSHPFWRLIGTQPVFSPPFFSIFNHHLNWVNHKLCMIKTSETLALSTFSRPFFLAETVPRFRIQVSLFWVLKIRLFLYYSFLFSLVRHTFVRFLTLTNTLDDL